MTIQGWISALQWYWQEIVLPIWWLWLILFGWSCYWHYKTYYKQEAGR